MPALPSSLSLTNIADGSSIIASDHRTNYAAVQTAVNALIAALSGGSAGQVLKATSASAVAYGNITTTSTLAGGPPGSPSDGDIWVATAVDSTNGVRWIFQYNSGSASAYKWECIGGGPVRMLPTTAALTGTQTSTMAASSFTLARGGDYEILLGAFCVNTAAWPGVYTISAQLQVAGVNAGYSAAFVPPAAFAGSAVTAIALPAAVAAGSAVTLTATANPGGATTSSVSSAWYTVRPVRIA